MCDGITIRKLSEDQANTPNIKLVFELLVMQHPNYSNFIIDENWAWAQKIRSNEKRMRVITSYSFKFRLIRWMRRMLQGKQTVTGRFF